MWVIDFDLCRDMPMGEDGVKQAVKAYWRNDHSILVQEASCCGSNSENNICKPAMRYVEP